MISIILAILFSVMIVVSFKLFSIYKINNLQAITFNYLFACIIGFLSIKEPIIIEETLKNQWLPYSIVIGVMFVLVFNFFAYSTQKVGLAITTIASKMSVILPILLGMILFKEKVDLLKIIGIICALLAFVLTIKSKEKIQVNKKLFYLPLLLFFGSGFNDIMTSFTKRKFELTSPEQIKLLLNHIFFFALITGSIIILFQSKKNRNQIHLKNIVAGILLGILNFASTYFYFDALNHFENAIFFPVFNVSIVSLSALIGFIGFKEKLRPINWVGLLLAIITIIIISLN